MKESIEHTKHWLDYTDVFLDPVLLVVTFILGYLISSWQVRRKEKRELDEQFEFFTLYLTNQRDAIKKQIEAIEETVKELDKIKPFKTVVTNFIIQPIELLDTLNKAHVTKSFEHKGYSSNDAVNLFVFINLCMENFKSFRESHLRFSKRQNDILYKWNEQIQDFHMSKMLSINLPKEEMIKTPELMELNKYYNRLCEIKPTDDTPENAMQVCIGPLKKYFQEIGDKNHRNKYANEYLPKLEAIEFTYIQSETFIVQQKEYLNSILQVLNEQWEKSKIDEYST